MSAPKRRARAPEFSTSRADHAVAFIETYCRHTKGRWGGQPIRLEPWQRDEIIRPLFGDVARDGRRRYREGLIGLARKNGKSTLASAIALYLLIADEEAGAEVYSAAGDKLQARIVFGQAREMVQADPYLRSWCKVYRDAIEVRETSSVYRVLSADAPLKHGLNVHGAIIDELHVHRDPELFYALRTGVGARSEPLVLSITTAGYDAKTIARQRYDHGRNDKDPRFFYYWAEPMRKRADGRLEPDPEAKLGDLRVWKQANPASWRRTREAMREELTSGLPEPVLRRLYLNQWTKSGVRWLPIDRWDACGEPAIIPDGAQVRVGVDVAPKHDSTAVALVRTEELREKGREQLTRVHHGVVNTFTADPETGILNFEAVENLLRDYGRRYDVIEVVYDPYMFTRSALMLADEGLNMVEFPQTNEQMVPASQALFDVVQQGRLRHGGDRVLREQADAAVARETSRGWRIDKLKSSELIDGIVALAMPVSRAENLEAPVSVYEERGLETV